MKTGVPLDLAGSPLPYGETIRMASRKRGKQVVVYTAPGCAECARAKGFLRERGIPFREMDVTASPRARKELQRLGARGVPVLLIGDERMDGFDPKRFFALYRG